MQVKALIESIKQTETPKETAIEVIAAIRQAVQMRAMGNLMKLRDDWSMERFDAIEAIEAEFGI